MNWHIYGHLPFTLTAAGCAGWGNYPAASALALIGLAYCLSGIAYILANRTAP